MKKSPHHFIPLPEDFEVSVPSEPPPSKKFFEMNPDGVYITWNYQKVWLYYASKKAGEKYSYASFELPSDPEYLRGFSEAILELAEKIENGR